MHIRLLNFLIYVAVATGSSYEDVNALLKNKSANYNEMVRPIINQSLPVNVYVNFQLMFIQGFDEVAEKLTTIGYFELYWIDELMSWDPNMYGELKRVALAGPKIWKPSLVLANPCGPMYDLIPDMPVVNFNSEGWALISPGGVYETTCTLDMTYYPWDEQDCSMYFVPWGYSKNDVALYSIKEKISMTFFEGNGVWKVEDSALVSYVNSMSVSVVEIKMKLRRKPTFIIINILLPVVFMSFLNTVTFLIPAVSGERFSYCITVLLAIAVFLTIIGENMPKTSHPISMLSYYLLGILFFSVCIVLASTVSLRMYFRDDKEPIPCFLKKFVRLLRCRRKKNQPKCRGEHSVDISNITATETDISLKNVSVATPVFHDAEHVQYKQPNNDFGNFRQHEKSDSYHDSNHAIDVDDLDGTAVCWKDVSVAFDNVCFLFFMFCLGVTTTTLVMTAFLNAR